MINRYSYDDMQAPVAVFLWLLDVVLNAQKPDVILLCQRLRNGVDIVKVGADDPHA